MILELGPATLRPLQQQDSFSIARYADNRKIWRNLRDRLPHPYSERDAQAFIASLQSTAPPTVFAIQVDAEAVGVIGFEPQTDVERLSAEVGFWLGKRFWGRGIATLALNAVAHHALQAQGLLRLYATVFEWNPASMRMLEKAGYVREGVRRKSVLKEGQVIDSVLYARVRD